MSLILKLSLFSEFFISFFFFAFRFFFSFPFSFLLTACARYISIP